MQIWEVCLFFSLFSIIVQTFGFLPMFFPSKLNSLSLVLLFSLLYKVVERRGFLPMSNHLFSSLTNNPRCGTQDFGFQLLLGAHTLILNQI